MGLLIAALALTAAAPLLTGCERSSAEDPHTKDANAANNDGSEQTSSEGSSESPHLAPLMGELQRYSQKLGYAIQARNGELGRFYMHEVEQALKEAAEQVPEYEGHDIAGLSEELFIPSLEQLDQRLEAPEGEEAWAQIDKAYQNMIGACNTCHVQSDHGFIVIEEPDGEPPFNQRFEP